ncbi:hypothetical protein SK854_08085 [Lentzea sp. BCCO 10_0061]|uniref:Transposase n=1 Tax=Lentzea sokolovensis TaxID=3095429 RepID=A0ABU4US17_9PSEU|nr:hypothetical protein [Lentzea sp. BCCO 10_0061]MDX8142065.1 hypothetical protein [Lentzea sp. BCCO 10_0061]
MSTIETGDPLAYKQRYALKRHRGVAPRYDKLAARCDATVHVTAIDERL